MNRKQRIAELEADLRAGRAEITQARAEVRDHRRRAEQAKQAARRHELAEIAARAFRRAVLDGATLSDLSIESGDWKYTLGLDVAAEPAVAEALFRALSVNETRP